MMDHFRRILGLGLLALVLVPACQGGEVTVGNINSNEGNTIPFGGLYPIGLNGTGYQQVYAASDFTSSPYAIDSVTFYTVPPQNSTEQNGNGTYTISLSTTSAPVNGLSTDMASNIGADNTIIFSGALPTYVAGSTLTFTLATPFTYDPSQGNLLLNMSISGVTNFDPADYVSQNGDFGSLSSRMVDGNATGTTGYGLVTTFNIVPEPGTLSMAILGLAGGAGIVLRRRQARA